MSDASTGRDATPETGSVAEEAARLVEAFASWSTARRPGVDDDSGYAGRSGPRAGADREAPGRDDAHRAPDDGPTCEACGARTGVGRAESCGICPLCQGIAWLRSVHPETLDRLADLAATVTEMLRDVATQSRARDPRPEDGTTGGTQHRGASVQHIPVEDDDTTEKRTGQ